MLESTVRQHGGILFRTHLERIHIKKLAHLSNLKIEFPGESPDNRFRDVIPYKHLVITGKNGSGKTALLDSIDTCLLDFAADNKKTNLSSLELALDFYGSRNKGFITDFRDWLNKDSIVYDYYPADNRLDNERISNVIEFLQKMKQKSSEQTVQSSKYAQIIKDFESSLKELFMLDGDVTLDFRSDTEVYIREGNGIEHLLGSLSHGYTSLLGIYGTLRSTIHQSGGFPETIRGLILIDEPELHLHISLQKTLVPSLTKLFPKVQFIIATHSPLVLKSVSNAVVFDLDKQDSLSELTEFSY